MHGMNIKRENYFYLWGMLKDKVFNNIDGTDDDMQERKRAGNSVRSFTSRT
jgi:hypothetical protein